METKIYLIFFFNEMKPNASFKNWFKQTEYLIQIMNLPFGQKNTL